MASPAHVPVLLDRVVALLAPALDARGRRPGRRHPRPRRPHRGRAARGCALARVIGIDRDPARPRRWPASGSAPFGDRFTGVHAVYDEIPDVLDDLGLDAVDAVLFDLGVSSMQLDVRERGFAYAEDAPLDMRMDGTTGPTAADVLNTYPAGELTRVLRDYGEEKFARKIAGAVVRAPRERAVHHLGRLVELLYAEIPAPARRTGGHPAKRTFQALRMEVNDELAVLRRAIPAAIDAIGVGGRVVVESYHSLEDRLVKQAFTAVTRSDVPPDLPFVPEGSEPALRLVTRGAEQADAGRDRRTTPAPPRSGCAPSNASDQPSPGPAEEQHEQCRARVQLRPRLPAASPRPPSSGPGSPSSRAAASARAADAVRDPGQPGAARRRRRAAAASTPRCSRRRSPPTALEDAGRPPSPPASRPCRSSSSSCATRSTSPPRAQRAGMVRPAAPAVPPRSAPARSSGEPCAAAPAERRSRSRAARRSSRRALDPPPIVDRGRPAGRRRPPRRPAATGAASPATRPPAAPAAALPRERYEDPAGHTSPTSTADTAHPTDPSRTARAPAPQQPRGTRRGSPQLRLRAGFVLIAMVLSLFGARLVQLQGVDPSSYAAMAAAEGTVEVVLPAERGDILDRNGEPLADSIDGLMIVADPTLTDDAGPGDRHVPRQAARRRLLPTLDQAARARRQPVRVHRPPGPVRPRPPTSSTPADEPGFEGLSTRRDPVRDYPAHDVAANLVGFVGTDEPPRRPRADLQHHALRQGRPARYEVGGRQPDPARRQHRRPAGQRPGPAHHDRPRPAVVHPAGAAPGRRGRRRRVRHRGGHGHPDRRAARAWPTTRRSTPTTPADVAQGRPRLPRAAATSTSPARSRRCSPSAR